MRPPVKPYVVYLRVMFEDVRAANPDMSTNQAQAHIGRQWRVLSEAERQPFNAEAARLNRQSRVHIASVDQEQLLVRHEIWLKMPSPDGMGMIRPRRLLVHYLGDDAFQRLTAPPRPIIVSNEMLPPGTNEIPTVHVFGEDQPADVGLVLCCRALGPPRPGACAATGHASEQSGHGVPNTTAPHACAMQAFHPPAASPTQVQQHAAPGASPRSASSQWGPGGCHELFKADNVHTSRVNLDKLLSSCALVD